MNRREAITAAVAAVAGAALGAPVASSQTFQVHGTKDSVWAISLPPLSFSSFAISASPGYILTKLDALTYRVEKK